MNMQIKHILIEIKRIMEQTVFRAMSDELFLKLYYKIFMQETLDLKHPLTFNQKLQWLKLHDRNLQYVDWVDKYEVKKYIASMIGGEYVVPLLGGPWNSADDIEYDKLPDQFVLKTTHGCGGIVICRDRNHFDKREAKKVLEKSLRNNYFYVGREWPYKNVKPRIIAEKYLESDNQNGMEGIIDYKFYCFHGTPEFLYVSGGLENHDTARISFCNIDYTKAAFKRSDYEGFEELPPKPLSYDKMLETTRLLSKGIPFVRVDFFENNGHMYFSELTFSPCSGFMKFSPEEYDRIWGEKLKI